MLLVIYDTEVTHNAGVVRDRSGGRSRFTHSRRMPRLGVNQSGPYAPLTRSFSSASADTNAIAGAGVPRNRN